jgi:hypothetical protein
VPHVPVFLLVEREWEDAAGNVDRSNGGAVTLLQLLSHAQILLLVDGRRTARALGWRPLLPRSPGTGQQQPPPQPTAPA